MFKLRILGGAVFLALVVSGCANTSNEPVNPEHQPEICHVTDKAQIAEIDDEGTSYPIYLVKSDCGVYQADNSELYSEIQIGNTYAFQVFGPRIYIPRVYAHITNIALVEG